MSISEAVLQRMTEKYWIREAEGRTEWYIENLLPLEMAYSAQPQRKCDTLTLLVGYSPDPLLQTIWVYQPKRIFLVLSEWYGDDTGEDMAYNYVEWIELMAEYGLFSGEVPDPEEDMIISTGKASPDWIFNELRSALLPSQQAGERIVVDITGAKKNMAAGAFLFAAYMGAKINYVDFDKYDDRSRRPYGYTCNIGPQPNPYQTFGLRDWEQIQRLYSQFAFGQVVGEIKRLREMKVSSVSDQAEEIAIFTPEQLAVVSLLQEVMVLLETWESGDFTLAFRLWKRAKKDGTTALQSRVGPLRLPPAVSVLGQAGWPSATLCSSSSSYHRAYKKFKCGDSWPEESLFNKPEVLLTYAHDELDKINRLIHKKEDHRSAFLRAAGLDELLLKARVAVLWLSDNLVADGSSIRGLSNEKRYFDKLADYSGGENLRLFLQQPTRFLGINDGRSQKRVKHKTRGYKLKPYWNDCGIDHQTLVNLRHEAIHTALSVSPAMAEAAYKVASQALADFEKNWIPLLSTSKFSYQSWDVSWEEITSACGIDFLPKLV